MPPVKVYAVINQKGGVGKTTTVANLGAALAACGHSVCLIDLDPQANLTLHFGIEPEQTDSSVYDVMSGNAELSAVTTKVGEHLWLAPSRIDLAAAEVELVGTVGREQVLRDLLVTADLPCELVMIDCPPSLGLLTLNALAAADEVLIPLQPHFFALQGLGKLLETVALVKRRINPKLRVGGVILCMYEPGTRLAAEVAADVTGFFESARTSDAPWSQAKVFQAKIRRNVKLAECPSHGRTIFDYDPHSRGAEDYLALAEEFLATSMGPLATAEPPASTEPEMEIEAPQEISCADRYSPEEPPDEPSADPAEVQTSEERRWERAPALPQKSVGEPLPPHDQPLTTDTPSQP